jgi:hypothetical protein
MVPMLGVGTLPGVLGVRLSVQNVLCCIPTQSVATIMSDDQLKSAISPSLR